MKLNIQFATETVQKKAEIDSSVQDLTVYANGVVAFYPYSVDGATICCRVTATKAFCLFYLITRDKAVFLPVFEGFVRIPVYAHCMTRRPLAKQYVA